MPPTPNPSTPSYAHDPGDPQHPHTAAQKQGAPSEKEIEGGKWRGTDRDSPALLPPSIRERSRRNPRSCGAAGAAHTPAPGAGNPGSSAAVEAEPEACGRGFGAVAGGEVKVAEEVRAGAELGGDWGGGGGGVGFCGSAAPCAGGTTRLAQSRTGHQSLPAHRLGWLLVLGLAG